MMWASLDLFSERRFGGWRPFLVRLVLLAWMAGFVAELAQVHSSFVPFDIMSVLFVWPGFVFLLVSLLAWMCTRLWPVSFLSALGGVGTYLPVLFFVPVVSFFLQSVGFSPEVGFANGWRALTALLTGGVLPLFLIPIPFVLVWVLFLGWLGWSWWRTASVRNPWVLLQAMVVGYVGFPFLFLLPSLVGWAVIAGVVPIWSGMETIVGQGFVAAQIDGFAWRAVYERFPLAIGGEAHVSRTWLFALFTCIASSVIVFQEILRTWRWSWKQCLAFIGRTRLLMGFGVLGLGMGGAFIFKEGHLLTWTHALAFFALILVTGLFLLVQAGEIELLEMRHGSLAVDRPLAAGLLRSEQMLEGVWLWRAVAMALAMILGTAVFLAFIFGYLAHRQALSARHPWAFVAWTTLPLVGYFLAGWMAVAERGSFGVLAPALALLVFLALFVWNWRKFGRVLS